MQKLRKVISISVMALTVFVMSGLGSLASAASAQPGDLVKAAGNKTVYYLGSDSRLYNIPNEDTYFSWYKDWSGVITISVSDLNSYGNGIPAGFVTMRPGTRLIQRDVTTDNTVYAVETNGILRPITTANAIALYGSTWASRVTKVSDQNFLSYTVSTSLPTGQYPIGTLLKKTTGPDVFYFDGTNYRRIANEAAFNANRFNARFIVKTSMSFNAGGNEITGMESGLINAAQNGGTIVTPPVVTGSGLTLSLNANTPAASTVPQNGARVPMAKVNLTAANDGAITVNSITVKRIGLSTYDNIEKVWAEKDGTIVAPKKSMNSNDESILTFSPAFVVPAGQTVSLDLLASLKANGSSDYAGNIGLSIASASAVSATASNIAGSFPVNGNIMSTTNYSVVNLSISGQVLATSSLKVGDNAVELGKFELGTTKDVVLTSVVLKNNGVEDLSKAVSGLYLEQAGNKVSSSFSVNGRFVTFYFNSGTEISKDDSSKIFYIKGDVVAKENSADNSLQFVLNKSTDLAGYEKATGFGFNVSNGDGYVISNISIDAGSVSVTKKSTSPAATTIIKGSDNTVLIANVRADEAITADGLNISYVYSNALASTTSQFENARVYVNGILIDSFDPIATTTGTISKAIDSTFTLNKGDNEVKVVVKAKTTATPASDIKFVLSGSAMLTNMNPEYVLSGNRVTTGMGGTAEGAIFTVQGAGLTTVKNDGYQSPTKIVQGSSDVSLGKFVVKATNDTVKVTSIALSANNAAGTKTLASSINDMKLFVDGVQVGNTIDFGTSGANFSSLNFTIAKDSTKNIEIKGSFDSSATDKFQTTMTVNAQDSRGTSITSGNTATTTDFSLTGEGTLNVALGADTRISSTILAKAGVEQEIAQYRLTALDDAANITELTATTSASIDPRISEYRLYDGATLLATGYPVSGVTTFTITDSKLIVPANGNKTVTLKAVLNEISVSGQSNGTLQTTLTGYKFKSSVGAETSTTTLAISSNIMNVRKTMPTFALVSGVTGGQGSMQSVLTFTVAADANEDVVLKKLVFTESGSASGTSAVSNYYLYEGGVEKVGLTASTTLSMDITVAKGTAKTFTVKADTSAVPVDATFGLSLEKGTSGANIGWEEYFVGGNSSATGEYLSGFPISGSTMKY